MEVKNAKVPPLKMVDHFFSRTNVVANENVTVDDLKSEIPFDHEFKCFVEVFTNKDDHKHAQVRLNIKTEEKENALKGYDIDVEVVGIFEPESGYPEDNKISMISVLGATLLYGAAREYIYSLTLRGPWPALYLPTRSFIPDEEESV